MNDRELLELAAKAAGIPIVACTCRDKRWPFAHNEAVSGKYGHWNPLESDGDALRLAVKLNLGISIPVHQTIRADVVCFRDASVNAREGGDDPYAAARRAIVRAAAEIGKAMP